MFVVLLFKWVEKLEYTVSGLNTQRLKEQWDFAINRFSFYYYILFVLFLFLFLLLVEFPSKSSRESGHYSSNRRCYCYNTWCRLFDPKVILLENESLGLVHCVWVFWVLMLQEAIAMTTQSKRKYQQKSVRTLCKNKQTA